MTAELILLSRVSYRDNEITAPRLRGLLALLAADLRAGCGTARLVDELWPDERPENPTKALQILVSRIRSRYGPDLVVRTPTGYRLGLEPDQVDSSALLAMASASAQHARAGDHAAALEHAEAGLALWDGTGDDGDDPPAALRADRAATRRSLARIQALALSRLGRHGEAVEPLTALAGDRPHDEEILLELLRAEAATKGPPAALSRYEAYRRTLRDELGTEPGAALRELHERLLQGDPVRDGVPHDPNPLLGRDTDVAAVTALIGASRVTTVVGPGGLGKTRLAHAVGRAAEQRAVHLVALAGVGVDDDVEGEVASVVGAGEGRIVDALGPGTLLILDNCEHVLRGAADLVRSLVSTSKDLRVLTTSRAPLGLSSEALYPLPELDLPTCVALFTQRARAARPDVDLPEDTVADLCARLDGLPLAVELAAARVRVLSVRDIADRLADRFTLLRGGPRDAPTRHQTLHAVVDWSWNLLDPAAQQAMTALATFPGGFTATAATWLIPHDVLETLTTLADQSLIKPEETPTGTRYRMLETVREFAQTTQAASRKTTPGQPPPLPGGRPWTSLPEAGGWARKLSTGGAVVHSGGEAVDRFLAWATDLGLRNHDAVFGPDAVAAAGLIRAEQDNLLHALRIARDTTTVVATAAALMGLWTIESNYTRLAALVNEFDPVLCDAEPTEVTRTALSLSTLYKAMTGGPHAARTLVALRRLPPVQPDTLVQAIAPVLAASPDELDELCSRREPLLASSANGLAGYRHEHAGDLDAALAAATRALALVSRDDSPWLWAQNHCRLAELCLRVEDGAGVRKHLLAGLPVLERLGSAADLAGLRGWMVLACLRLGALDEAGYWLDRVGGDCGNPAYDVGVRAEVLLARGETDAGLALWRRVLDEVRDAGEDLVGGDPLGLGLWAVEARSVAVVAHARHGRVDLLGELPDRLAAQLSTLLRNPFVKPPPYLVELPIWGALLLALGMTDLARRDAAGARLVALADACGFLRNFQPTMSSERAREAADGPAYADAVSEYAGLGREELRQAALAALSGRG